MSEISFPVKDLTRRKTQTILTICGLTISIATTIFLVIFGSNLGFEIKFITLGGRLTSGFHNIFSQFIFIVGILNLLTGAISTSFIVHLNMSGRMHDIGVMKASGCLSGSIFAYFATELSLLVLLSSITGIVLGASVYYISTSFLNAAGFYVSQTINTATILVVSIVIIIFCHIFGALPIRKAARAKPTDAMSLLYQLGTTAGPGSKIPSRLGLTFKVVYRSLVRRKTLTVQAIVCLTLVSTLTTVTLAGGLIANQTTISYVERAIGKDVIIVGHPTVTERYVTLLSQFFETKDEDQTDYLNSEFIISESFVQKLDNIQGVNEVDPRLIWENSVREIPGIIPDPIEETKAVIIGSNRVELVLILGVKPENLVNNWLILGRSLEEEDELSTMIGDSLAVNMFEDPFNQSIKIFDNSQPPFFEIVGVCVDPLNNGRVVYMPMNKLSMELEQEGYNLLFLKINPTEKPQVLSKIKNEISEDKWNLVELNSILDRHVDFLDNIWSLFMLLPLFTMVAAAFSLLSYLMLSIADQQHEFGVMRALGAKSKSILKIVFSQAFIIIIISGTIGISIGLFIAFTFLFPEPVISQNTLISLSGFLLFILCLLCASSLYPAMKASKKTVAEAISRV